MSCIVLHTNVLNLKLKFNTLCFSDQSNITEKLKEIPQEINVSSTEANNLQFTTNTIPISGDNKVCLLYTSRCV